MFLQYQDVQEAEKLNTGKVVFAGVGNTLAGDDGAGIFMLRLLEKRLSGESRFRFIELEGDLYSIWDILSETEAFIFLDAVAGERPGEIREGKTLSKPFTPSFHQSDLSAVMDSLESLWQGRFPPWTLWGVTISPPEFLGEGLSPPVEAAAFEAVERIINRLETGGLESLLSPGGSDGRRAH
ncbi:hypothetical protein CSA37_00940 [Candidatus Fermentibacteria bacterium]|nr:MAG: hypothetical protein CSA37_00940 [Candidatus Fermentibacteria bacterium]